ncbi:MAG: ribosome silencing factor [Ignavibacteria bacterium]|nr:ribosome silencing factor [Ignavibacteria bacterium]
MARDITVLDISKIDSSPADFFVVVTVDSDPQLRAVSNEIIQAAKAAGMGLPRKDGKGTTTWMILDYFDIVIHVMLESARSFYKLEKLWGDGKFYSLSPSGVARAVNTLAIKKQTE